MWRPAIVSVVKMNDANGAIATSVNTFTVPVTMRSITAAATYHAVNVTTVSRMGKEIGRRGTRRSGSSPAARRRRMSRRISRPTMSEETSVSAR